MLSANEMRHEVSRSYYCQDSIPHIPGLRLRARLGQKGKDLVS